MWIQQGSIHVQIVYDVLPCLFDEYNLYPRSYIVSWTSWVFWVYCSSALFQNQNCSNKIHKDSSDHMPHFPGLQKKTRAETTFNLTKPPRLQIEKKHQGTTFAIFTNQHFRLYVLSRLHMLDMYANLNFDSWSTKATVLAYGQTGSGKTYTMVWLPRRLRRLLSACWACYHYHHKKEG